jgi:hypothetical protein
MVAIYSVSFAVTINGAALLYAQVYHNVKNGADELHSS